MRDRGGDARCCLPWDRGQVVIASRAWLATLAILFGAVNCHRDPLPSAQDEWCESNCVSMLCLNPDLEPEVVQQCEVSCRGKFGESARQGTECEEAFSVAMNCVAELTCEEYESWYLMYEDDPCPAARGVVAEVCIGIYLEPEIGPP